MSSILTRIFITISLIVSTTACGTLSTIQLDATGAEAERYARTQNLTAEVEELAKPMVENGHTPGIVIGVLTPDGTQHYFAYGVADKTSGITPDADTLFPVGSLSKGFLGVMTALMIEDGAFSWDDTLKELLPEDTPLSDAASKITLRQLATHTSGLPRQPMTFQTMTSFIKYLFTGESFYQHLDDKYVLNFMSSFSAPAEIEPHYSNIGYGLLGYILELKSNKPLDLLLKEKITAPLNLTQTGYEPSEISGYSQRARGYAGDHPKFIRRGTAVPDWDFTTIMKGSAAIHSTARDLLSFAQAHLCNDESAYCSAYLDTLKVRYPRESKAAAIAWVEDNINDHQISYQVGVVAGYTSYLGLDVKSRTAVVVLQNSFNWGFDIGHRLLLRMAPTAETQAIAYRTD